MKSLDTNFKSKFKRPIGFHYKSGKAGTLDTDKSMELSAGARRWKDFIKVDHKHTLQKKQRSFALHCWVQNENSRFGNMTQITQLK